jgi:hypothetical protein
MLELGSFQLAACQTRVSYGTSHSRFPEYPLQHNSSGLPEAKVVYHVENPCGMIDRAPRGARVSMISKFKVCDFDDLCIFRGSYRLS